MSMEYISDQGNPTERSWFQQNDTLLYAIQYHHFGYTDEEEKGEI